MNQRFLLLCSFAFVAGVYGWANDESVAKRVSGSPLGTLNQQDGEPTALQAAVAIEQALVDAIAKAEPSIVAIARIRKGAVADPTDSRFVPHEFGSGVIIDADGSILTNYHVLGNPDENDYVVWVQRRPFRVVEIIADTQVSAADPWTDLAILKIEADDLSPIEFGSGETLRKGQLVVALGNPYGIARDGEASASWGMISNLNRRQTNRPTISDNGDDSTETIHHYGTLIQTDAKLELGTSGGALINLQGQMIGLTSAIAAMDQYESSAGFAIPVDESFRATVERLRQGEPIEYGLLGVSPRDLSAAQRLDGATGISVAQVVQGTPAEFAGVKFGDRITHLNGEPIQDSIQFMRELGKSRVGTRIILSVERDRVGVEQPQLLQLPTTLSKKYFASSLPMISQRRPQIWRGLQIDYATAIPNFSERSRFVEEAGCVAVVEVERDSPAWRAGLRPRDFISLVGSTRVSTPADFLTAVDELDDAIAELTLTHSQSGLGLVRRIESE